MDITGCAIEWDAPADLQLTVPESGWNLNLLHSGTLAATVRAFLALPEEQQRRCNVFTERGVIEGTDAWLLGPEMLKELARHPKLPGE